jgi:outer membrane receptor protein involved in Fe transport
MQCQIGKPIRIRHPSGSRRRESSVEDNFRAPGSAAAPKKPSVPSRVQVREDKIDGYPRVQPLSGSRFANIGDTRRRGMELGIRGKSGKLGWYTNYSFVQATFEDAFSSSSPSHPAADANGDVAVRKGNRIPGIPGHGLQLGLDYEILADLGLGGDLMFNSDQHLRGDEANLLDAIDGYAIVNLNGEYRLSKHVSVFGRI